MQVSDHAFEALFRPYFTGADCGSKMCMADAVMTRREWKIRATARLAGTESPALVAGMLLCHVLGIDKVALVAHDDEPVSPRAGEELEALLLRRLAGEPVAYLLGEREFYGRDFLVNRHTLIPRPETEHLVEEALFFFQGKEQVRFLDLGTGSGCIAVTLAAERPSWQGTAVDVSADALEKAEANAARHGTAKRLTFLHADFTLPLPLEEGSFDLVASNPPYVSEEEYAALDAGVRNFEPRSALVPGPQGLEHPRAVEAAARALLKEGGLFLMEHGHLQGEACRALCPDAYWTDVRTGRDLAGKDRFLSAVRRSGV